MRNRNAAFMGSALFGLLSGTAHAQQAETVLVQPSLPEDFDKGRNISVMQRSRPEYDAIGIQSGGLKIFPEFGVSVGYSDNVYNTDTNKVDAVYVVAAPSVRVESDWSRHVFKLRAGLQAQRFPSESRRNQTPWDVGALLSLDVGPAWRITPEVQIGRLYESAFGGETVADRSVLSNFLRKYVGTRAEYTSGQAKFTVAADNTDYQFSTVTLPSNVRVSQADRNRSIMRFTGQAQYAFTPSVSVYAQGGYIKTDYDRPLLTGAPNRDSDGYRAIAGFNFDLAGLMRGTIGAGYGRRDFKSPIYRDVGGLSAEAKLEYFPSELTTFTISAKRVIEDSNLATIAAFYDNRARVQVDHELLRNLILSAYGEVARQDYIRSTSRADVYRFGFNANYLSSNWLSWGLRVFYTGRNVKGADLGQDFGEFTGALSVTFKR